MLCSPKTLCIKVCSTLKGSKKRLTQLKTINQVNNRYIYLGSPSWSLFILFEDLRNGTEHLQSQCITQMATLVARVTTKGAAKNCIIVATCASRL